MRVPKWFVLACAFTATCLGAAPKIQRGELEGAKYAWAQPDHWNGSVLILAHGYVSEDLPLNPNFNPEHAAYKKLIDEGWLVAKTSYRRNGLILADGIADIDNLRAEIARRMGAPERVIVEGDSMGGTIAVLIAERAVETPTALYQGVIAVDPGLNLREPASGITGLSMQPKIPVVFLCNRNEIDGSRSYRDLNFPRDIRPFAPALLRVNRDGHVNVNQAERLFAIRYLTAWIDSGSAPTNTLSPQLGYTDATRIPDPQPSRVFLDADEHGFTAHVSEISGNHGNILLDAQPADFEKIGLRPNAYFQITIRERNFRVLFGRDFNSVKRGEWVAFPNADGFFWLGRNFADAAKTAECKAGDLVQIRRYEPQ
ncbi:MAG TPA: SAM hydroxide adenosyltransferase [Opitutaceae bacterium]|nr:SAM hydroxide adenosyltransferase [Opitutaceae bacterium]